MKKKIYIGSNLKMYKDIKETVEYLQDLTRYAKDISREEMELFILPSYLALESAVKNIDSRYIRLGAQNMHWKDEGQFTGEVSPLMLKKLGIGLVMIGHSERRHLFKETDFEENKKVKAALNHGFTALLCIGETEEEKRFNVSEEALCTQLKIGLDGISLSKVKDIWIAYEPVWSIGVNGMPASAEYAQEKHEVIKSCLCEIFGERGREIPVLYGGSVNLENAGKLIEQPSIDGLFIGRAAWQADKFNELIRSVKDIWECR